MIGEQKWKQKEQVGISCYGTDDGDQDYSLVEIRSRHGNQRTDSFVELEDGLSIRIGLVTDKGTKAMSRCSA